MERTIMVPSFYSSLSDTEKEKIKTRSKKYYHKHKAEVSKRCYLNKMKNILHPKAETLAKHGINKIF